MIKALIYCRVSSQRQVDEGHGLEGQEKRCRDYAKARGYSVVGVFKDEGVSGGVIDRPGMQRLLSQLEHETETVIVLIDDIKRLARDVQGHFTLKTAIYSRNAKLESPSHKFEDSPEGKFVETVLAGAAELERNQNKLQVINRMRARLELGYWPFMPPLALKNVKDPVYGKILTPVEPHASVIKKAIESYRDGVLNTQDDVKRFLHEEYKKHGLPNRPSLSTTKQILVNPLYAGFIEYEKWGVPFKKAQHEGFISIKTFNAVQERLQRRTKPWKRRDYSKDFPLRPFVLCDACGKPMTSSWNRGRSARYPNYFCRHKGCKYNWKVISKYKLESEFEQVLSHSKPLGEYIDLAKDIFEEQWELRLQTYTERRTGLRKEIQEADESIKSYLLRIRKSKDEDIIAAYEDEIRELKHNKVIAEAELGKKRYTNEEFGTAIGKVFDTLRDPMSMWKSEDYNDKKTILFMYFGEELRYDYEMGFGTACLAYPVKLISDLGQAKNGSVEMSGSDTESENRLKKHLQA